jgi:hypothetical protein
MHATQIGGKYSTLNPLLFSLKRHLIDAGYLVSHPIGDCILKQENDVALSFDPVELGKTFYEVELDYYHAIKTNPFHVVCNAFNGVNGYLGESAAIEICYAMQHDKHVIMLFPPLFAETIPNEIKVILKKCSPAISVARLDQMPLGDIAGFIEGILEANQLHPLTVVDEICIMEHVKKLLVRYNTTHGEI